MTEQEWLQGPSDERGRQKLLAFFGQTANSRQHGLLLCSWARLVLEPLDQPGARLEAIGIAERCHEHTATAADLMRLDALLTVLETPDQPEPGKEEFFYSAACFFLAVGLGICQDSEYQQAEAWAPASTIRQRRLAICLATLAQINAVLPQRACVLARCVLGNPFRPHRMRGTLPAVPAIGQKRRHANKAAPPSAIDQSVLLAQDAAVLRLATAIDQEGDCNGLPILADALQEAGCPWGEPGKPGGDLLRHLRGQRRCPGCRNLSVNVDDCPTCAGQGWLPEWMSGTLLEWPADVAEFPGHSRGCWALDLLLDR